MFLPDINVWLALAFQQHLHHSTAVAWFAQISDRDGSFCRQTQQGFLRLATTPAVFGKETVVLSEAWRMYDSLLSDPRVVYVDEPSNLELLWRIHTQGKTFSPKIWNDAYLAAFAQAAGWELVTFDKGFGQYKDLRYTILS